MKSLESRHLIHLESEKMIPVKLEDSNQTLAQALKNVIETLTPNHQMSYLLATVFFAKYTKMLTELGQTSVTKLSAIAKKQAIVGLKMPDLTDSMRREVCIAVGQLLKGPRHSPYAVWLLGLFYKVLSPDKRFTEDIEHPCSDSLKWIATDKKSQKELAEMVKHHEEQLHQHDNFAETVFRSMFSAEMGNPHVLRYLGRDVFVLLCELQRWIHQYSGLSTEQLNAIIETVADVTKAWFRSRQSGDVSDKTVLDCLSVAVKIIMDMKRQRKSKHPESIISILKLLNSFSEVLAQFQGHKEIEIACAQTYPEVEKELQIWIMAATVKFTEHDLKVGHLDMIIKSKKWSEMVSIIINDIWKDSVKDVTDWEYLLTNPHSLELLTVLEETEWKPEEVHGEWGGKEKERSTEGTSVEEQHWLTVGAAERVLEHQWLTASSSVNTEQIRENIAIDLSTESRPLNQLLNLWKGVEIILKFERIKLASRSRFFKTLWKSASEKDRQANGDSAMSLCGLHERVYMPTLEDFTKSYEMIKDRSMHVDEFETVYADCTQGQIERELALMKEYLNDNTENTWIKDACKCVERYRVLCNVGKQAQAIYALKEELKLEGDFQLLLDIQRQDDLKTKRLRDFTDKMELIGRQLRDFDDHVLSLLEEYKDCVRKGFIKWIKSIIKDQRELNVFVELASAFAGENPMDLDKVRNFRDAVFACAPFIFALDARADFDGLMGQIGELKEPVGNDPALSEKLVLEQVLHAGQLLIKLREVGHILFMDWCLTGFCEENRKVSVHVDFGIAGLKVTGRESLLEELKGICKSLQACLEKWVNYTKVHRDEYYYLNYFTAKQLSTLSGSMADMKKHQPVSSRILNMLSFVKENVAVADLQHAFTSALKSPIQNADSMDAQSSQIKDYLVRFPELINYVVKAGYTEASAKAAVMFCQHSGDGLKNEGVDEVMDCVFENVDDDEWVEEWSVKYDEEQENVLQSQLKFTGGHTPEQLKPAFTMSADEMAKMFENLNSCQEKIMLLWDTYCGKLSGLVSDKYIGLDLLGETLKQMAHGVDPVRRELTRLLDKGKPNLVSCNSVEMLPQCLSLYLSAEQPLPTYDEILICTPETTVEEVELIIRRAVQSGSRHEKIYSLLNAENLNPEVARVLESRFCHLSQNQKIAEAREYSFVIFCNAKAHQSYVLTAFDEYRKVLQAREYKEIQQLLKIKHKLSSELVFPVNVIQEECRQNVKMVVSARAGMGKTLFVKNLIRRSNDHLTSQGFTNKTISITDSEIKPGFIYEKLKQYEDNPVDNVPRIFHFDVPPVISTDLEDSLLEMFTTVRCFSPEDTLKHLSGTINNSETASEFQLMDDSEFRSEGFQRTYQYLNHFQEKSLENLKFDSQKCPDSPQEWLKCILHYCKINNPSWAELCHFTQFLNVQLKKCEESIFCSDMLHDDLTGFRDFVVKFMITMSTDFIMPSLETSDESGGSTKNEEKNEGADDVLNEFQIRKHWEQEAHPYIMFNSDGESMTFLGFHIQDCNAVDIRTGQIIEKDVISTLLFEQLKAQKVPMNVDFKTLSRRKQLEILCRVLGVKEKDPDSTYQLTLDNALKILAIHLRFECNIPVVIMGETGCGKTRLVKFMCDLLRKGDDKTNLLMVRVHGGTTSDMIYKKVEQAVEVSKRNRDLGVYTVLFFDEANTTEAVYAIKEVMCDRTIRGEPVDAPDLKFVAACNPYRKHTQSAIKQLEKAGLGYRVRAEDTSEKLGQIPMRQLVYRVQPLPASLSPLVWDFGKLNTYTQELYIAKMVETFFTTENLKEQHKSLFTNVINISQTHMTESNECRMVSLRDIERCMKTAMWFYQQKENLFPLIDQKKRNHGGTDQRRIDDRIRSLILAVGVCYSASLEDREEYLKLTARALSLTAQEMLEEIDLCQEVFVDNVDIPAATAKNDALKENVFMMIVCMNLRLPLFLVGKPGSSKSLSKTVAADALQGKSSHSELFKSYKQAQLLSFQCSAHSTSDGIISTFRQCAQLQNKKNLDEFVSVVVLDEIGLAEDSPKMPLKTLHPLLECGSIDDEESEEYKKVGFIGMSNWSLDPAKMNRGLLLFRPSPGEDELKKTATEICSAARLFSKEIEERLPTLTKVYSAVLKKQVNEFYGLRDYYSLIKVIVTYAQSSEPSTADLARAVQRNFGVLDSVNSLDIFSKEFNVEVKPAKTIDLVKENLQTKKIAGLESRYLLLMSSNNAALSILLSQGIISYDNTEIIFGSGFPLDQEYSQVCRTVNRIKTCMETGRSVVLLNIQNLYESLYDALNQCYVKLGGSYYVDIGLGAHRVKCKVKEGFRLIVIEEINVVYAQFPTPLLSRLEKHCLEFSTILPEHAERLQAELEKQIEDVFCGSTQKTCDALIGFTADLCASVMLQGCPEILSEDWDTGLRDDIIRRCRGKLVQCAALDSIIRVKRNTEEIQNIYFKQQTHTNLMDVIKKYRQDNDKGMCLEVSTYSLLLNQRNLKAINEELNLFKEQSYLLLIREFQTEQAFCEAMRYCITKLLKEPKKSVKVDVVLLIRLPRISGGCGYIAMSGDEWDCVHLDELMPTKGLPADMLTLCQMPMFKVFGQHIVHNKVSRNFFKVLEKRVFNILSAREKEKTENWVIAQAQSNSFVVEGTSFRHVLWVHLEDAVASAMAPIFAVVDGDNNLDHMTANQPCDKTDLWIKIFQEEDLLTVPALLKQYYSVLSTSNAKETVSCRFPFSWVVKARFDQIWRQIQNLPETSKLEQIEKCQELLYNLKSTHSLFNMYAEDLVRMSMPECSYEVNQAFSVSLVELAKNLYKDWMRADPDDVSLFWLHVAYEELRENHQIFCKLFQKYEDMINTRDVREANEAMHLLLEKLQPSKDLLGNYDACLAWLNRVKSLSSSVELIVAEDSLVQRHGAKGEELIRKIRCRWQGTQVVYLLIDNLLQDETHMDEKLLDIMTMNFIHFSKRIMRKDLNMEQTFTEVSRVLKQCNTNACNAYLNIDCASCGDEFKDPVELPCGHIFCKSCIEEVDAKDCFTCNKPIDVPYKPCERPTWEAIIQMNKFRRHCNSFFVEFIMKCFAKENTELPDGVANQLLDFVRGSPEIKGKPSRKTTELSPFHESMYPSPAVKSLVLRILLNSRMDQIGPHLQRYIEMAVKSNQQNTDEFYFMVVRCTEDQIQRSAHKALISKAVECANVDFSPSGRAECDVTFDVLHNIAKARFAVSVATDVIGGLVQTQERQKVEEETNLLFRNLQETFAKHKWVHMFLIRNLCNKFGFKIIQSVQHNEKLNWIVPKGLQARKSETGCPCDRFVVYGAMYTDIVMDLTDTYSLKEKAGKDNSPQFPVCAALAAVRQSIHDVKSAKGSNSLMTQVETVSKDNKNWQNMSAVCRNVTEDRLSRVSKELRLSHESSLWPVVLHAVIVVNQSTSPELKLLKTLCSQPGRMKKTFIPTMPDIQQQMEGLKKPHSMEKIWKCQCGEAVLIENCGGPVVVAYCPKCRGKIGGTCYNPVPGFTEMQTSDNDQMGYILGDASKRSFPGCERNLSGASLCLVRALIHSCLLWGAIDNHLATEDLLAVSGSDVGKFLCDHLQKDIELLGKALGKNTENAEIAIHMFLRNIIESPSADCDIDFDTTETRDKRNEWENIMQFKTTIFFKNLETNLSEVHNNILKWGRENPIINIVYNEVPNIEDLATTGPYNCPLMWRYEQKMTIQYLTHLIEQDSCSKQYPALLDLLRKHGHIQNIKHLPQILSLQQRLIHHFHYVDSSEWKDLSFEEFLTKAPQADVPLLEECTNVLLNIWEKIKDSPCLDIPADLKAKDKSNVMISDLLPSKKPPTMIRIVTHYLAKMQNDCISSARIRQCGETEAENLKPSHVITCDLEEDFLPIAISNTGYVVHEDGTETVDYNFKTLEKQLINRFISEKPHIKLSTLPIMERNPAKTLQSFFSREKKKLVPLSIQDKNYIMKEMRLINEISAALSTLKIAIGFLEISFSSPDMLLVKYMKQELRMEDRSKHLELPVLKTCRVKHIQSLWEVLFIRRSVLLTEMNQEPFYMISQDFHAHFSKEEEPSVSGALARIRNMDLFVTELHDVIMNIETKGMKPEWDIKGTFDALLYEKELDESSVNSLLEHLNEDLKMTHVVSLWKHAVRRTAQ
ncbi:hypothetical protein AOLI_G00326350 [Acnodon oligacanthus]